MQSPVKKEYITQEFGANPAAYKRFGLNGHNGIDLRAFLINGDRCYAGERSPVYAPHDGKIIENAYDASGFGNYVKIENDKEGSVLAHFSSKCKLNVGDTVKMGDFIAYQGTTGNSTGIHLHWGYYKKPRDRSNGYNGFINQKGLFSSFGESKTESEKEMTANNYKGYDLSNAESMKVAVDVLVRVQGGEFVNKADFEALQEKYQKSIDEQGNIETLKAKNEELKKDLQKCIEAQGKLTEELTMWRNKEPEKVEVIKEVVKEVPVEVTKEVKIEELTDFTVGSLFMAICQKLKQPVMELLTKIGSIK